VISTRQRETIEKLKQDICSAKIIMEQPYLNQKMKKSLKDLRKKHLREVKTARISPSRYRSSCSSPIANWEFRQKGDKTWDPNDCSFNSAEALRNA
jgi:hypothetical protein